MTTPTHNGPSSDADVAQGGLDVENALTEMYLDTAARLGSTERVEQQMQGARQTGGRSAMEMLTAEANAKSASEEYHYEGP